MPAENRVFSELRLPRQAEACPKDSPKRRPFERRAALAPRLWPFVRQAILPVRMGLRPTKGDENLAEVHLSRSSFDARTGGRVADRVNGKSEAFDRAGGLSGRRFRYATNFSRLRCGMPAKHEAGAMPANCVSGLFDGGLKGRMQARLPATQGGRLHATKGGRLHATKGQTPEASCTRPCFTQSLHSPTAADGAVRRNLTGPAAHSQSQ